MLASAGAQPAPARSRRIAPIAVFAAIAVLLALVPLVASPPVGLVLDGPSLVPVGKDVAFGGRYTLASFGMSGAEVDVMLDDALLARVVTDERGAFSLTLRMDAPGAHVLRAIAADGSYARAETTAFPIHAVEPPRGVADLRATRGGGEGVTLSWSAPVPDADRPAQEVRVYAAASGMPWRLVESLPPEAVEARAPTDAARFAVATANVAGESEWRIVTA